MKKIFLSILSTLFFAYWVNAQSNTQNLQNHVLSLSSYSLSRSADNIETLNEAASYIKNTFQQYSKKVVFQKYEVNKQIYQNVLASFGPDTGKRFIIGAHYDAVSGSQGADDNASGVAGLLELARLLEKVNQHLLYRIDLVAYTLEEPPYFATENMGSFKHAKSLMENNIKVIGMINLECIGFFSNERGSQRYPFFLYKLIHGSKGNFISVVQKDGMGNWSNRMKQYFKQYSNGLKVVGYKPIFYPEGTMLSDHRNYWAMNIPAVMITNSAFYKNKNYHTDTDTAETLNYEQMKKVVDMVFQTMLRFKE